MRKIRLKKFVLFVLCFMLFTSTLSTLSFAADTIPARTLKVLAIGNSFSEDATQHLYQIAQDLGAKTIVIGNLY